MNATTTRTLHTHTRRLLEAAALAAVREAGADLAEGEQAELLALAMEAAEKVYLSQPLGGVVSPYAAARMFACATVRRELRRRK